jgi:SAM-dependent methyltransferase
VTREELVLANIDTGKGVGLEIGPLTSPIVKRDGAKVFYADHMSQAQLREKYKDAPLDVNDIVQVDFIVKDTLVNAVGGQKFDYVVACHVIEHVPDTVRWFEDIAAILKPGGTLALAIPDKRYTFDIARYPSTPGDIVGAYLEKYKRPAASDVYDFAAEGRDVKTAAVWANPYGEWDKRPHLYSLDEAYAMSLKNLDSDEYIDCHCHVFTPHSFVKVLRELMMLGLTDFEVESFRDTNDQNIEFYASLRKAGKGKDKLKRQLASLPKLPAEPTLARLNEDKKALEAEIASLQTELSDMRGSKSWKITGPLRQAVSRLSDRKSP